MKVHLILHKNKRHFSFSPRTLLENIFINRTNFFGQPNTKMSCAPPHCPFHHAEMCTDGTKAMVKKPPRTLA